LMGRTIFTETDGVMGHDIDDTCRVIIYDDEIMTITEGQR